MNTKKFSEDSFVTKLGGKKAGYRQQRGVVLFIALIVLVMMTLAGIAIVRSVDTNVLVAGNLAFKQAASQAGETGINAAFTAAQNFAAAADTAVANQYFPTMQNLNAYGIPTTINWNNVPSNTTLAQGFTVQFVVERLCRVSPVTSIEAECVYETGSNGSKKAGATVLESPGAVFYRATVRVTGPNQTQSFLQGIFEIPISS